MNNLLFPLHAASVGLANSHLQQFAPPVVSPATTVEPAENSSSPDKVDISEQARHMSRFSSVSEVSDTEKFRNDGEGRLSEQELRELRSLKQRDIEVRAHEQAHLAAAGQYARGGASFSLERGPDGALYAVGGQVGIDLSKERTPEDTARKMQTVRRAALAPLSPSAADRSIAARAAAMESEARQEILLKNQREILGSEGEVDQPLESAPDSDSDGIVPSPSSPEKIMVQRMIASYSRFSQA